MKNLLVADEYEFDIEMSLEHPRVERYLKVGNVETMRGKIDEGLEMANEIIEPRAIYTIKESDEEELEDYDAPEPLRGNACLAFGASTIGAALPERVDELMEEGKYSLSYILDSIGSAAVDLTADLLGEEIVSEAHSRGLNTTRVFAPGSGSSGWRVNNQRFIFANLNPGKIGVTLTSSFTMLPKKSNSLVMGLDNDVNQVKNLFSCAGCRRTDCPARDVPEG